MTISNQWDKRYSSSTHTGDACWVLANNLHLLPPSGKSLDLACGLGANALLLAEQGMDSYAWDTSAVALEKLRGFAAEQQHSIHTEQRDVEQQPPEPNSFDIIVVSQFLYRPIFPALIAALKPNGLLFYQTFHQHKIDPQGPSNPDYLLASNELLRLLQPLELLFYREDGTTGNTTQGRRNCSYFVGKKNHVALG
ncbi:class I SAM-dependent methyltransferase [Oceanicoccus sagamiensis]|uniref:Methyltransferase domain-containing protein n=1 Tax=Oceanicoccus sagamiensis TaxID=716816 RepID=A0A1X9NJ79_9GAMM|nr:class I SAM-dependent methyltransferase [Oceanicoccus sagamiensis]ARN74043.1 hypothetical protein BST96_07875 [Oceanicoccus sagamiensis]